MTKNILFFSLRWIVISVGILAGVPAWAQSENKTLSVSSRMDSLRVRSTDMMPGSGTIEIKPVNGIGKPDMAEDSDSISENIRFKFPRSYMSPYTIAYFPESYYWGCGLWNLHEGFNANIGMFVTTSFGKNRFPGVGFGTGISAMYAKMLTNRLSLAVGGFYNHLVWGANSMNQVGANLMLGYQLTDRLSVYGYVSKAFMPLYGKSLIPVLPYMDCYDTRFGAMLHFNVNDHMSISVSVEELKR